MYDVTGRYLVNNGYVREADTDLLQTDCNDQQ